MSKRVPKNRFSSSTTYDASEEDLTDTDASVVSVSTPQHPHAGAHLHPPRPQPSRKPGAPRPRHHLAASILSDDGVDSPTYDGDVESSATVTHSRPYTPDTVLDSSASASTLTSPVSAIIDLPARLPHHEHPGSPPSPSIGPLVDQTPTILQTQPPTPAVDDAAALEAPAFNPASLTPEDIQQFARDAINGGPTEKGVPRKYKIAPPPVGRPVRIYADGVYDLFHFGHALQLRQAKFSFPDVYLIVGCNSDEQVKQHKNKVVMTHTERCEALSHCRWVDQVVPEAPWVLTPEFLEKFEIDYVAHDEDPYAGVGVEDIYQTVKDMGKFLPTRRTPGVSTSELLERIVLKYRMRDFDSKLEKMGHAELKAAGSDYDDYPSDESVQPARARSRRRAPPAKETAKEPEKLSPNDVQ